jgi:hypothetical protein
MSDDVVINGISYGGHYTPPEAPITDADIVNAMARYGGGFVSLLAKLYRQGDEENRARIKATWPEYWKSYADYVARETVVRPR